jgi:hypothetical protein
MTGTCVQVHSELIAYGWKGDPVWSPSTSEFRKSLDRTRFHLRLADHTKVFTMVQRLDPDPKSRSDICIVAGLIEQWFNTNVQYGFGVISTTAMRIGTPL